MGGVAKPVTKVEAVGRRNDRECVVTFQVVQGKWMVAGSRHRVGRSLIDRVSLSARAELQ